MLFGGDIIYAPNSCSDDDEFLDDDLHFDQTDDQTDAAVAASTTSSSSNGGANGGHGGDDGWWTVPGAYSDPTDRPGVVDAICKLQGRGNKVHPSNYMTINLGRRFKDMRKKRIQKKLQRDSRRGSANTSNSSTPAKGGAGGKQQQLKKNICAVPKRGALGVDSSGNIHQPTCLAEGFAMYRGKRKESALASAVDSEVVQVLDSSGAGDDASAGSFLTQTQPSFASNNAPGSSNEGGMMARGSAVEGASPAGRLSVTASLAGALYHHQNSSQTPNNNSLTANRQQVSPMDVSALSSHNGEGILFGSNSAHSPFGIAGGSFNSFASPSSASQAYAQQGGQSPFAVSSIVGGSNAHQQESSGSNNRSTSPQEEKQLWDRIIKRCNSNVPILTQQGKRALPLGERAGDLSSMVSNGNSPTDSGEGSSLFCPPPRGGVADMPAEDSNSTFFDTADARQTVDLGTNVDFLLSQCE